MAQQVAKCKYQGSKLIKRLTIITELYKPLACVLRPSAAKLAAISSIVILPSGKNAKMKYSHFMMRSAETVVNVRSLRCFHSSLLGVNSFVTNFVSMSHMSQLDISSCFPCSLSVCTLYKQQKMMFLPNTTILSDSRC